MVTRYRIQVGKSLANFLKQLKKVVTEMLHGFTKIRKTRKKMKNVNDGK